MKEEWKAVIGYAGWYLISNRGRVMRTNTGKGAIPGRILKHHLTRKGYHVVKLFKGSRSTAKTITVHRLVAAAFIGVRPDFHEVNHKDANKDNNTVGNLEYLTTRENILHAIENGCHFMPDNSGSSNGMAKLNEGVVRALRLEGPRTYSEIKIIAERLNVSGTTVRNALIGKTWAHVDQPSPT